MIPPALGSTVTRFTFPRSDSMPSFPPGGDLPDSPELDGDQGGEVRRPSVPARHRPSRKCYRIVITWIRKHYQKFVSERRNGYSEEVAREYAAHGTSAQLPIFPADVDNRVLPDRLADSKQSKPRDIFTAMRRHAMPHRHPYTLLDRFQQSIRDNDVELRFPRLGVTDPAHPLDVDLRHMPWRVSD